MLQCNRTHANPSASRLGLADSFVKNVAMPRRWRSTGKHDKRDAMYRFVRAPRFALAALLLFGGIPANSQDAPAPQTGATANRPAPAPGVSTERWLYRGSDLEQDPDWRFGTLPNGLRYAVRRNGVPPGQIAVRVRIDAGSLMERDSERGFAHLIEHLSFRGSEKFPDSESKRVWQRLGVTFGSDSNAATTFTDTVYKLDLPAATPRAYDESMAILADMMNNPRIDQAALDAERPVVLAELREREQPQSRFNDRMLATVFAGQPIANRTPIGTVETLNGATAAAIRAFHDRWYRPERAVVIVSGDMDPAQLEATVIKHFSAWRGTGPAPAQPDFGRPVASGHPVAAAVTEPTLPPVVVMAVARPWSITADTVLFNQERYIDFLAARILSRRLESRARGGGSFIAASVSLSDVSRSANITTVQVLPIGDDWEKALKDVRGTIADAMKTPPSQAEIDREVNEIDAAMRNSIATAAVQPGAGLADTLAEAIDINETTTTPAASHRIFRGAVDRGFFTPERIQAATRKLFEGTVTRAVVNTRTPDPEAVAKLSAALAADVSGLAGQRANAAPVSFDSLPPLARPGRIASRDAALADPKIEKIAFANGVNLLLFENPAEVGRVYVRVRFGRGQMALRPGDATAAWAAPFALMASGIGNFGQEELDRLTGNRQIGLDFAVDGDAFVMGATTSPDDLQDQLRLFAAKLTNPRWDPNPVIRARAAALANEAGYTASPDGVLARELERLLHGGDPRWGVPDRAAIEALTPEAFRRTWEPLLATGPIEVQVYGNVETAKAIEAVARTFGALRARRAAAPAGAAVAFPAHVAEPVVRYHRGQANQAAAVIAWPTGGGSANLPEARKLEILAAVIRDRALERLRSQSGVSYSPNVASDWPVGLDGGGRIMAATLLPPDKTGFFFETLRGIAADLRANPITNDELRRALVPLGQLVVRRSSGNPFWLNETAGGSFDPARIRSLETLPSDLGQTTPAELQALAVKYLTPDRDWTMVVLPQPRQ